MPDINEIFKTALQKIIAIFKSVNRLPQYILDQLNTLNDITNFSIKIYRDNFFYQISIQRLELLNHDPEYNSNITKVLQELKQQLSKLNNDLYSQSEDPYARDLPMFGIKISILNDSKKQISIALPNVNNAYREISSLDELSNNIRSFIHANKLQNITTPSIS
jgi:hypothetical protein